MSETRVPPNIAKLARYIVAGSMEPSEALLEGREVCDTTEKGPDTGFEKLFEAIDAVNWGNYRFEVSETVAIVARAKRSPYAAAIMAFKYGFLKGERAGRARQKALRKKKEAQR